MSNYFIELFIIHMTMALGYWLLLRNERQYGKMRSYLVGSTLLAIGVPFLKLPELLFSDISLDGPVIGNAITIDPINITPSTGITIWDAMMWSYFLVSAFFLIKFITGLFFLIKLERKSSYEKFNDIYVRKVENIEGSFTFFNWIFLNEEIDKDCHDYDVILKHEQAHASLGHSFDLMLMEVFKICFWWLPSAWFMNKEIRKIHEYQADAYALKSYHIDHYSSILISSTLKSNGMSLASSFHDGLILKRLLAMKQQVKQVSPWKIGALSGLMALMFIVFACTEELETKSPDLDEGNFEIQENAFTKVEDQPSFPGGMGAFYSYLAQEIKYPRQARQLGVEGRVYVQFVVEKDGSLSDVTTIKGIGAGCDAEAERVIRNAPAFNPGKQRGKALRARMVMPISFSLNGGEATEENAPATVIIEELAPKNDLFKVEATYTDGAWSGTIYSSKGNRLPGVNIVVEGTQTGTVSDLQGNFRVEADESRDLLISFIGFETVRLEGK